MNKALGLASMAATAVEFVLVGVPIAQPRDCDCDQPRIASIPAKVPEPDERPVIAPALVEKQVSAVTQDRRAIIGWAELEVPDPE
jgi:hypothetical protein